MPLGSVTERVVTVVGPTVRQTGGVLRGLVAIVVSSASIVACTGDGDDAASSATSTVGTVAVADTGTPEATEPAATSTVPPTTAVATIATVPEEGVPGIDSTDAFCRAWSEYGGTFQALALASNFAADPAAARRAEVVASPAVVRAVAALGDRLPDELEEERAAFLDDLLGPFARRAERARAELVAAGLGDDDLDLLVDVWLLTLVDAGVDDPDLVVVVPPALDERVDAAVASFSSDVPPIAADPSLVTDAAAPATLAYLSANCPDQATLAGNDIVDG